MQLGLEVEQGAISRMSLPTQAARLYVPAETAEQNPARLGGGECYAL